MDTLTELLHEYATGVSAYGREYPIATLATVREIRRTVDAILAETQDRAAWGVMRSLWFQREATAEADRAEHTYYTVEEAAARLNVGEAAIRVALHRGRLAAVTIQEQRGAVRHIKHADLETYRKTYARKVNPDEEYELARDQADEAAHPPAPTSDEQVPAF